MTSLNWKLKSKIIEKYGSQANFALTIKAHESDISRVVRNRRQLPKETKDKWAKALDCKIPDIFEE